MFKQKEENYISIIYRKKIFVYFRILSKFSEYSNIYIWKLRYSNIMLQSFKYNLQPYSWLHKTSRVLSREGSELGQIELLWQSTGRRPSVSRSFFKFISEWIRLLPLSARFLAALPLHQQPRIGASSLPFPILSCRVTRRIHHRSFTISGKSAASQRRNAKSDSDFTEVNFNLTQTDPF